ncbi:MAG: hypothetical protein WBN16_07650 [Lutimonas sp.]
MINKMDIQEIIRSEKTAKPLPENHKLVFEQKLDRAFHQKDLFKPLLIAASMLLFFGLGLYNFSSTDEKQVKPHVSDYVSVGDFSPELKKLENYYITAINYQLANLNVDESGKEILAEYLKKLNELTQSYKLLSQKLQKDEIDEALINALIDNLQMRLGLMLELKNELKKINSNENKTV